MNYAPEAPAKQIGSAPVDVEATGMKTKNEKYYDTAYQKWQLSANKFGAIYKKRYWRDYIQASFKCVEFGSSSGYILQSMPCAENVGIELNDAAREYSQQVLKLKAVQRTAELPTNYFDFVFSTSVLEHVECPICEIRGLYALLKKGGILSITTPGQAKRSSQWKDKDVNFEFQMYGGLELGNILTAAGFTVDKNRCSSEMTQWPENAEKVYQDMGSDLDKFIQFAKEYAPKHNQLVTTWCVGTKK